MTQTYELGKIFEPNPEFSERENVCGYSILLSKEMYTEETGFLVAKNALAIFQDPDASAMESRATTMLITTTPDSEPMFIAVDDRSTEKAGLKVIMASALGWDALSVTSPDDNQIVWYGPASVSKQALFGQDTKELSVSREDRNTVAAQELLSRVFALSVELQTV